MCNTRGLFMELVKIPTNVGFVDFSGYVLIAITALLMFYVIPHVFRRRSVLAEARIEERYAEDLRMLDVNASRSGGASTHTGGPHGTVFFRQPEVIMKKSEQAPSRARGTDDVRVIAKERARRRARISQRNVNKQRGILGGAVIGIVTVVAWVLMATTGLAIAVPAVLTLLTLVYGGGFGVIVNAMAEATVADEEAIEKLNAKLRTLKGSAHVAGSRRPQVRRRPSAKSARSAAESESVRSAAESESIASGENAAETEEVAASADTAAHVEAPSQISITTEAEIVEDTIAPDPALVDDQSTSAKSSDSSKSIANSKNASKSESADSVQSAPKAAESPARAVDAAGVAAPAAASVARGTARAKEEPIKRQLVTPYEPPEEVTASVPYRPKDLDERFEDEKPIAASSPEEVQGLSGGSALDALLDRRRA
ncbi:hypothetical protein DD236_02035 [Ancrocorticia populi]|uniref:Uncharacterized protein n=2 Tax=Ancrocorticia populi TaxID=2175228 RepID=A0A2V1K7W0_9ACTO|nr:hypothetical protein DD236_02035 [Ancrocorticia populi]